MTENEPDLPALMRELDDPQWLERPQHYNRGKSAARFGGKFGSLALVCADNPGAFLGTEDARTEGELDGADLAKVSRALVELGYVVVAEELLEYDYDGPSRLPRHVQRPSWWHRFFGFF